MVNFSLLKILKISFIEEKEHNFDGIFIKLL